MNFLNLFRRVVGRVLRVRRPIEPEKPPLPTLGPVGMLLSDPSRWTTLFFARNSEGNGVVPDSNEAVCWCLAGAARRCYPDRDRYEDAMSRVLNAAEKMLGTPINTFIDLNDGYPYETVFAAVVKAGI